MTRRLTARKYIYQERNQILEKHASFSKYELRCKQHIASQK